MQSSPSNTVLTVLQEEHPRFPQGACATTVLVELPPGDPGTPPRRHAGPVFGYMTEGEMIFELEGEPERIIRRGEAFWEPGGDVIHYRAANPTAPPTDPPSIRAPCPREPSIARHPGSRGAQAGQDAGLAGRGRAAGQMVGGMWVEPVWVSFWMV